MKRFLICWLLLSGCDDNSYYNILGYEINEELEMMEQDSTFNEISETDF